MPRVLFTAACCALLAAAPFAAPTRAAQSSVQPEERTLADAQRLFYNAHYEEAAALAQSLRASGTHDLASDEVRTTALLFVLRGLLKGQDAHNGDDKAEALKRCVKCPEVLASFEADLH